MKSLLALVTLASTLSAFAVCPEFSVPNQFKAREQLISIGTDMELSEDKARFGDIEQRTIRLTPTFELYNIDGKKVASARQKIFSWGTSIEVKDCENKLIGSVKENIISSIWNFYTRYDILDAKGNIIAASKKMEFFTTNFTIYSNSNEEILKMTRPGFNIMNDIWTVSISKSDAIDARILTMIPAFKTAADNKKRQEEANKNNLQR